MTRGKRAWLGGLTGATAGWRASRGAVSSGRGGPVAVRLGAAMLAVLPLVFVGQVAFAASAGRAGQPWWQRAAGGRIPVWGGPPAGDDWPSFGYDPAQTRDNTRETALTPASVHLLRHQWTNTSPPNTVFTVDDGPAVAGGVLYQQILISQDHGGVFTDITHLEAIDVSSGKLLWRRPAGSPEGPQDQTAADGLVFTPYSTPGGTNELLALSPAGHLVWAYRAPAVGEPLAVSGGVLYTSSAKAAYAFDAATGRVLWKLPGVFGSLAVAGGTLFLGTSSGVEAITTATHKLLWTTRIPGGDVFVAVSGGRVFALSSLSTRALSTRTGTTLWRVRRPNEGVPLAPAVNGHALFYTSTADGLYAYNVSTGALLWSRRNAGDSGSSPAVADGVVYEGSANSVDAFNASTGALLWHGRFPHSDPAGPAIADGHLYVCSAGTTYAYGLPPSAWPPHSARTPRSPSPTGSG